MEIIMAIVSLVCSILTIFLFFKVWCMCNDVEAIKKKYVDTKILPSELIFLHSTNDPLFDKMLARAIYDDLRKVSIDYTYSDEWEEVYQKRLQYWVELCAEQGWQFPEALRKEIYKEFRDFFNK